MITTTTEAKPNVRLALRAFRTPAGMGAMLSDPTTGTDVALCYSRAWAERLAKVTEYEAAEYARELARVWGEG